MSMQRCGIEAIEAALDAGEDITRVLALRDCDDPRLAALLDRCMEDGIDVILGSENDLWRMAETSPALALALVGRQPEADLETMLERGGLIWMLAGAQYQTNIGYCIRVAEVSGANGLIVPGEWSSDEFLLPGELQQSGPQALGDTLHVQPRIISRSCFEPAIV